VIHTDRVVESGVGRTGIDQMRESQLLDVTLPLERRSIDDPNRRRVEPNRVPKRIADDPLFTVGRHVRTLAEAAWPRQWLFAPARSILTERKTKVPNRRLQASRECVMDHLKGLRVVDLSQNLAGPYCTQILADLGAEVTKVEPPAGDAARAWAPPLWEGHSPLFLSVNRGKQSIQIDLKSEEGKDILWRLIDGAEVFVQSSRSGVIERLGFDYEAVRKRRPDVIYVSVMAYGPTGPLKDQPGYDPLMQAYSGLMSITGHHTDAPARVGASVIDFGTGMWGAIGVLSALQKRTATGEGSHVITSLLDTALGLVSYHLTNHIATGEVPGPMGSGFPMISPYRAFPTSNGTLVIAAGNNATFQRLCEGLALPELPMDPRFATNPTRVVHREELFDLLAEATHTHSTGDLWKLLQDHSVPCSPIQDMAEVVRDEQVEASGMLPHVDHPEIPDYRDIAMPVRWDGDRPETTRIPPRAGEHTREILSELGYEDDQVAELMANGIVLVADAHR
jgi:crotonobetainyl-CoA:carnitine CoA-transferase CaiB-like acyl-CoA transferase